MKNNKDKKDEVINARCYPKIKDLLKQMSKAYNLSEAQIVSNSILEYHQNHFIHKDLPEIEQKLFGRYGSGQKNIASNAKKHFGDILDEKYGSR